MLNALARWGAEHAPPPTPDAVMAIRCARCDQDPGSADWCTTCAQPMTVASTRWSRASDPAVLLPLVPAPEQGP